MKSDQIYDYPCTRIIDVKGFGAYLEQEIQKPRRNLRLFTKELSDCLTQGHDDISHHITLTNSGSSANLVAALALAENLRKKGRPLTAAASAFTFPTTMSSLLLAGFKVELVDVDEFDFNISVEKLSSLPIPPSVVAVTHFLGFPANMDALNEYRNQTECRIMQDACETLVCRIANRNLYEYGDIVTWSFYHPHHLSAYGGGAVYAADRNLFVLADSIAHWGRECKCHIAKSLCNLPQGPAHQFTYENIGVNVEMSELNACFGRWQLRNWEEIEKRRRRNYADLYSRLKNCNRLKIWDFHNSQKDSPFVFPILCRDMDVDEVWKFMRQQGVEIRTLMGGSTSTQKAYKAYLPTGTKCTNAEYMSRHAFFVGCHSTLSPSDIFYIANSLRQL